MDVYKANASHATHRLHAAAPALLEACKLALADYVNQQWENDETAVMLRAAIALAEGDKPVVHLHDENGVRYCDKP